MKRTRDAFISYHSHYKFLTPISFLCNVKVTFLLGRTPLDYHSPRIWTWLKYKRGKKICLESFKWISNDVSIKIMLIFLYFFQHWFSSVFFFSPQSLFYIISIITRRSGENKYACKTRKKNVGCCLEATVNISQGKFAEKIRKKNSVRNYDTREKKQIKSTRNEREKKTKRKSKQKLFERDIIMWDKYINFILMFILRPFAHTTHNSKWGQQFFDLFLTTFRFFQCLQQLSFSAGQNK